MQLHARACIANVQLIKRMAGWEAVQYSRNYDVILVCITNIKTIIFIIEWLLCLSISSNRQRRYWVCVCATLAAHCLATVKAMMDTWMTEFKKWILIRNCATLHTINTCTLYNMQRRSIAECCKLALTFGCCCYGMLARRLVRIITECDDKSFYSIHIGAISSVVDHFSYRFQTQSWGEEDVEHATQYK